MSEDISFGQNSLRLLYYRYKDSAYFGWGILTIIISICIVLLFEVVIPQLQNWFSVRNEVIATRDKIDVINKNINFMQNIDKSLLDTQVQTATSALPYQKDFGGIINALTDASLKTGISLDDFVFQVGDIASVSRQRNNLQKDLSSIKLIISISGNVSNIDSFLAEIGKKLPLSEIIDVDGDTTSTTVTLQFYQKQFPHIVFKDDQPLSSIPDTNVALLRKMEGWQPSNSQEETGSSSANVNVPLF